MSASRRSSLGSPPQMGGSGSISDLKQRVITCLNKLSDRDTLAMATNELEFIARNLTQDSYATFLICIHNTDASSKPPVRKQCVSLLTSLSNSHGDALAPLLPKMVSTVLRRLRDPDTAVRLACVEAVAAMSARITTPEFAPAFLKPLMDTLAVEQDSNSQIGAALCLAAAIDAAPEVEAAQLRRSLARLGKLAKSEGFRAKAALMVLIGSIVGAGGASSKGALDWLVPCVVEFLSSDDWAVRKGAAETLGKVATAESDLAPLYKACCLGALESRRFDKVKVVRETMNNALEMWKVFAGDSEEVSTPMQSRSSTDNENDRSFPAVSKSSNDGFRTPQTKKTVPTNRFPPSNGSLVTTAKKGSSQGRTERSSDTTKLTKVDHKKSRDWKCEITMPNSASSKVSRADDIVKCDFEVKDSRETEHDANCVVEDKRVLFSRNCNEKAQKFGGLRSRSRVVPFDDENHDSDVVASNPAEEVYESPKEAEDLNLIRAQLIQIENQQANLFDLLQRFMGNSQSGLNSLETRVHGLEMALDGISYDLAVSTGKIPDTESAENTCCKLPGAEFLSSKFWRRTEGRCSGPRFSYSGNNPSMNAVPDKDTGVEPSTFNRQRFQQQSRGAHTTDSPGDSSEQTWNFPDRTPKSRVQVAERVQMYNASQFDGVSPANYIASRNPSRRSSA
ncbi:TORTIFOLIA1-like protein 4 [Argentina anserina]|uniref:TORTIFOLIA1-like protein 4 n=1 Tax=Argentina anserina TaxID=57926 RepID=UPI0021765E2B|nr:TORTIFOLIA1-like protein 4 [Potentilla anserina]